MCEFVILYEGTVFPFHTFFSWKYIAFLLLILLCFHAYLISKKYLKMKLNTMMEFFQFNLNFKFSLLCSLAVHISPVSFDKYHKVLV